MGSGLMADILVWSFLGISLQELQDKRAKITQSSTTPGKISKKLRLDEDSFNVGDAKRNLFEAWSHPY